MSTGPRTTLTLEQYANAMTATQAVNRVWKKMRTVTGVLTMVRAGEGALWDRQGVRVTHKFRIMKPVGITITERDRLSKGEVIYNVKHVGDIARQGRFMTLTLERAR